MRIMLATMIGMKASIARLASAFAPNHRVYSNQVVVVNRIHPNASRAQQGNAYHSERGLTLFSAGMMSSGQA